MHEKGKNSIGLNGGVSGLSGTFLGLNYSTNNFLGLGETLSLQGNIGNLARNVTFAFTEPYLRNKPTSVGFQFFSRKSDLQLGAQLRPGDRAVGEPFRSAAVADAELQPVFDRLDFLDQLSA